MTELNWKTLCAEPLAQEAYVAFVQICKGGSDDAGTYEADEALVRRALKRLDRLEGAALAESEPEGPTPQPIPVSEQEAMLDQAMQAAETLRDCWLERTGLTIADDPYVEDACSTIQSIRSER